MFKNIPRFAMAIILLSILLAIIIYVMLSIKPGAVGGWTAGIADLLNRIIGFSRI